MAGNASNARSSRGSLQSTHNTAKPEEEHA
jgi:hypothetical protein